MRESEYTLRPVQDVQTLGEMGDINAIIDLTDSFIRKRYLLDLDKADIVPMNAALASVAPGKNSRIFKLASLAYGDHDDIAEKLANVFGAVSELDARQAFILDSDGEGATVYLGIAGNDMDSLSMQFDTFRGSFSGSFPGAKCSMLNVSRGAELLGSIFDEPNIRIASVSSLVTPQSTGSAAVYKMERLIDGMRGRPFTLILLADSAAKQEISELRQRYEAMYTQLAPFCNYSLSMNQSDSSTYTQTFNLSLNESVSEGQSVSESTSFAKTKSSSTTQQKGAEEAQRGAAGKQLAGAAISLAATFMGLGGIEEKINLGQAALQGLFYGGAVNNILGSAQTLLAGAPPGGTETSGESESHTISYSVSENTSRQKGVTSSKGISDGTTATNGRTMQLQYSNKSVSSLLKVMDKQLERLQCMEETGGFHCAAYFVAGDDATAMTAANMYRSLLGGTDGLGQNNAINLWSGPGQVEALGEYLKRLNHPLFHFERRPGYPVFTASTLVAPNEMPMYVSLPQKSVRGLPVASRAEFARDCPDGDSEDGIRIGKVFHLGEVSSAEVSLSKETLTGHLFVSGTTGMGKSNFCYGLLDSLHRQGVKFMVIEPAKGEYPRVFGGYPGVSTFGTNPNLTPLLRINPFSFPENIHVNEHIDRLLEIFNSCWPMYAAMPAVMKEGMETIYKQKGFNLISGRQRGKAGFPTFSDLLKVIPDIISRSQFSGEVKGNYVGSLVTRIKSLTDGLYGCIFTEDEIPAETLFEEDVLIDLSRIGSSETKALIMGMMVMKLQEHHISKGQMNMPLSHVTVLEEAHHLLKASGPVAEGVNVRAMSLEMITNAIAEMRTYGEGFIIADQSPALIDLSVIRNTNTKVVFKLPEHSDRTAVGRAISLSDAQIQELSRLENGVAAVYQSGWSNAVLAKIRYYSEDHFSPFIFQAELPEIDSSEVFTQCLAALLRSRLADAGDSSFQKERCEKIIANAGYVDPALCPYIETIRANLKDSGEKQGFPMLCWCADTIIGARNLVKTCGPADDMALWEQRAQSNIESIVRLNRAEVRELIAVCINICFKDSDAMKKLYFRHAAFCKNV